MDYPNFPEVGARLEKAASAVLSENSTTFADGLAAR
jgi:hypothetical protein